MWLRMNGQKDATSQISKMEEEGHEPKNVDHL